MKLSIKFLPAIALAIALAPFAGTSPGRCADGQWRYQTVVQSGPVAQMYPNSVGG